MMLSAFDLDVASDQLASKSVQKASDPNFSLNKDAT